MDADQRRLAAIMFTDVVAYSALTHENETVALELLVEHESLLRPILRDHHGAEVKSTGDGFLIEFASALDAVRCAVAMQCAMQERNANVPPERQVQVRIGIHLGDIVHRGGDVLGDGVNIAQRVLTQAEPGGICFSRQVFDQVQNRIEERIERLGAGDLKNIKTPVEIYRVALPWQGTRSPVPRVLSFRLRQKRARAVLLGALGVLIFVAAGLNRLRAPSSTPRTGVAPAEVQAASVAVLPFTSMSTDPENAVWTDGLTEHLTTALGQVKGFRVPARTSAFAFKGKSDDIRAIGKKLGVDHVLEGSVQKQGDRLRITAQLIKVSDGTHLWAEAYDRSAADIFTVQSDVALRVVEELRGHLTPTEAQTLGKRYTGNLEAWRLYQRGRQHQQRHTERGPIDKHPIVRAGDPEGQQLRPRLCRLGALLWNPGRQL
jgi:adenylate cyclase